MKVLLVITKSEIGGAQVFVLNLARTLSKSGVVVEVAAGDGDYLAAELKKAGIKFHYLDSLKRNISLLNTFYFIYDLYRLLKINKYNIIHLNSSNTLIGASAAYFIKNRPKTVFTFHGLSFVDQNFKSNFIVKALVELYFKICLKAVDGPVFVSEINYQVAKKVNIVKQARVIYNGLDEEDLHFLKTAEAVNYFSKLFNADLTGKFLIGSTGRLAYPKNYEFLIENFLSIKSKIPNAKVVLIGDGPNNGKYRERISQLGIQDDFFMAGSLKDSYKYIKAFDVFVLPSIYEGLSISLIEAIFGEIPILAAEVGGNPEIVGNSKKQLFKLNDSGDFIEKLLTLRNEREAIINFNSGLKKKFALTDMTAGYKSLYESLIDLRTDKVA